MPMKVAKKFLAVGVSACLVAGTFTGALAVTAAGSSEPKVLFEENFDDLTALPEGWKEIKENTNGKVYIEDGALIIDAQGTNTDSPYGVVYLGDELMNEGDYTVEVEYTPLWQASNTRYSSLMYRVQGTELDNNRTYAPYYHFTVRMNAATQPGGGVELTYRGKNQSWTHLADVNASSDLSLNTTYTMKVICKGNHIQQWLDDELLVDKTLDESASTWLANGGIGFQTSNMKVRVDNIKVTETTDIVSPTSPDLFNVYEPDTGLRVAPTVVQKVDSKDDYNALTNEGARPATAVFTLDQNLNVVDASGAKIATLDEAMTKIDDDIIPGFFVKDTATVTALSNAYGKTLKDATIFSDNLDVLSAAHEAMNKLRTAYWPVLSGDITKEVKDELIASANAHAAKILVLDSSKLTKEDVLYFQMRLMTVWGITSGETVDTYTQIVKGFDGLVTDDFTTAISAIESFDDSNGLIRNPVTIAHRGYSNKYPENTMAAFKGAVEAGASMIETDFHMTTDGKLVLIHDDTLDRTTNGSGAVASKSWDEIKDLKCKNDGDVEFSDEGIPLMDDLFEYIQDKDVVIVMEIKNGDEDSIPVFKQLVEKYGVQDKVVAITFYSNQVAAMREVFPEMSVGFLGTSGGNTVSDKLLTLINTNFPSECTNHPNRSFNSSELMEAAKHRGIVIHPWTYTGMTLFNEDMRMGVQFLTSNGSEWMTDQYSYLEPTSDTYTLRQNIAENVKATAISQELGEAEVNVGMMRSAGDDITFTNYDNGTVAADKQGTATVILKYEVEQFNGVYTIYSEPVTVTVGEGSTTPTDPPPTESTTGIATTTAPNIPGPEVPGMIKEVSLQANNAAAWYVKDWKGGTGTFVPNEYAVYPEIKVVNNESGALEITRRPYSQYNYVYTFAYIAQNVNFVDNKLYYNFTADCQWNFTLTLGANKDTADGSEMLNLTSYIMKEEKDKDIGYAIDGDPGVYDGCIDVYAAYQDAVQDRNVKAGLIDENGDGFIGRMIIWTVGGAEDADVITVNDLYVGREEGAPTSPSTDASSDTTATGTESTATGSDTTATGSDTTATGDNTTAPTNVDGTSTTKTPSSPSTGENVAFALLGAALLAASAGLMVFSRKKKA